jgi:hypothetical protein
VLHLHLVGVTVADHRLLDLQGGVLGDFEAADDQRGDRRATRLAEAQRRLWIDVDEDNFDRRLVGLVAGDQRRSSACIVPRRLGREVLASVLMQPLAR